MTQVIGCGEEIVGRIVHALIPTYWTVKAQVPIQQLINREEFEILADKKHKVDFAVWEYIHMEEKWIGIIRVQGYDHTSGKKGHRHERKAQKDVIQKALLESQSLWVVDILYNECPNIFKERYNWDAIIEFCQMFKLAKVSLMD